VTGPLDHAGDVLPEQSKPTCSSLVFILTPSLHLRLSMIVKQEAYSWIARLVVILVEVDFIHGRTKSI
jgi:hypothetical protein